MRATTLSLAISLSFVSGFSSIATGRHSTSTRTSTSYSHTNNSNQVTSSSSSLSAGFGGGGAVSSKNNKKNKTKSKSAETKLKPKQQWDRFVELKDEPNVAVAVRIEGTDEWLGVGVVKSQGSKYTPQAVFRQRALIVEHAKRLHPGQLASSNKQQLQWGYYAEPEEKDGEGQWAIVDKSCMNDIDAAGAEGIQKLVGFKGRPDPVSGFYTEIAGGRMDASALAQKGSAGSGGPVSGSGKKGTGDGVI